MGLPVASSKPSPFVVWLVPIGFTVIAALFILREPRLTVFNGIAVVIAWAEWARVARRNPRKKL